LLSLAFCIVDLTENIWDAISEIHLNFTDLHQWKFESSGIFSTRSPYRAFFIGAIHFESWKRLWKAWTPNKCKIFVWLVIHNRCWTADHLRRGLQPQTTAPSATKKIRQPNTYSLLVCMPGNSGSAFWIPWTCQVWYLLDILTPLRSGGESPGGKCQSSIRKVSTPLLYWEHGSSGNTESPVCLMDLLQIFGLPYRASKMNPT